RCDRRRGRGGRAARAGRLRRFHVRAARSADRIVRPRRVSTVRRRHPAGRARFAFSNAACSVGRVLRARQVERASQGEPAKTMRYESLVRPAVRLIKPYTAGTTVAQAKARFGLKNVVKLSSNENPLGPSPRAMAALSDIPN